MVKSLLKQVLARFGYMVVRKGTPSDLINEKEFISFHQAIKPYTMVTAERSFALYEATKYIAELHIEGDIVECGVWRGGQTMLIAKTLIARNDTARTLWLYDTYTGMSEPTTEDVYILPEDPASVKWEKHNRGTHNDWCYAPLEDVQANITATGYPKDHVQFVKGKVEDTIPGTMPEKIALLRLDTDWYESTRHELEHLFPRLVPGGVLILDDYGSWAGARKAVDEYFKDRKPGILLMKTGQGRVGVKLA